MAIVEWGLLEFGLEVLTRGWDAIRNREALYKTDAFVRAHQENLEKSIDNVRDISQHSSDVLNHNVRETLRIIAAVVKANIRDQAVEVNANYMTPVPSTDTVMEQAMFCDKKRKCDSYACFLKLQTWAHDVPDLPETILLPVDRTPADMLFGAPRAYATGTTQILNNAVRAYTGIDRRKHREMGQAVENYFRDSQAHIRSFASIPMRVPPFLQKGPPWTCGPRDVIGVVNVQANKRALFGVFKGNQRKMEITLAPFVHIVAHHVLRLHYVKPPSA